MTFTPDSGTGLVYIECSGDEEADVYPVVGWNTYTNADGAFIAARPVYFETGLEIAQEVPERVDRKARVTKREDAAWLLEAWGIPAGGVSGLEPLPMPTPEMRSTP